MNTFATTIEEISKANGEIRAGGTDFQERRRSRVSKGELIDITGLKGLDKIEKNSDGSTSIGTLVSIDTIANDPFIQKSYSGLAEAAGALATPQIRLVGTMGGSLLQRTRCHYYRNPHFDCYKKGGDSCPAREGEHTFGVCFDLGPCVFPHPSTLGMVLMAYGAEYELNGKEKHPIANLFGSGIDPHKDNSLKEGEVLTKIILPKALENEKTAYFRSISRARAEWPLVEVIARLLVLDNTITFASVAMGGVANIPILLPRVNETLLNQPGNDATMEKAAKIATEGANPSPDTAYKVDLVYGTVYETLRRAMKGLKNREA